MVKIDLITGFFGSGKTTFIRKYASYLMSQGQNIGILENDYGAINVDMMLLSDLRGDNCELEMVSGGCDRDCHRRRFKTKLISMGMCGYDRVLIEPSGIFDMDEFFDTLHEEPLDRWYEIGNVIAIVDAKLDPNLSEQADYVLASEAANAGLIVLSRSQEASPEEIGQTIMHLNHALAQVKCKREIDASHILSTDWNSFTKEDFARISSCGYDPASYVKQDVDDNGDFDSLFFMNRHLTEAQLCEAVKEIMNSPACGSVFRIKGFQKLEDGTWIELNATRQTTEIHPIKEGQEVLIVIGEGLVKEEIEKRIGEEEKQNGRK